MSAVLEQFALNGKVAVVTGGFGKLGSVWSRALLEAGAKVALLDKPDILPSEEALTLQRQFGEERLRFYQADVIDRPSLEIACHHIEDQLGLVDVLVNNAGIDQPPAKVRNDRLQDIPFAAFTTVMDVNTAGSFLCMQVFGGSMLKHAFGSIINIGSLYASVSPDARFYDHIETDPPFIKPPAYGASKAALVNLSRYFATHWAPQGIRVNVLSPGGVEGNQDEAFKAKFQHRVPMGKMAQVDDLAGPLVFLASDASRYVTGTELIVDGGFTAW